MAKDTQTTSKEVNQHKRLAMGEKVTGMKKGGRAMSSGGMACKKGGQIKKRGK